MRCSSGRRSSKTRGFPRPLALKLSMSAVRSTLGSSTLATATGPCFFVVKRTKTCTAPWACAHCTAGTTEVTASCLIPVLEPRSSIVTASDAPSRACDAKRLTSPTEEEVETRGSSKRAARHQRRRMQAHTTWWISL